MAGLETFVAQTATTRPTKLGQPFTRWSIRKLLDYLHRLPGRTITIGREALRTLLHRRGITFQRTKTWKESLDPDFETKLDPIEYALTQRPERTFAFDEFGPLGIRPTAGTGWAPQGEPDRLPATYHRTHGVTYFHGCYSVGDDLCPGVDARSGLKLGVVDRRVNLTHGALVLSSDPFQADSVLHDLYHRAVSATLKDPEIRDSFDRVSLRPLHVRAELLRGAANVLNAVAPQRDDYVETRDIFRISSDEYMDGLRLSIEAGRTASRLVLAALVMISGAVLVVLLGLLSPWGIGLPAGCIAALCLLGAWLSTKPAAIPALERMHARIRPLIRNPVTFGRDEDLRDALEEELVAQARAAINALRQDRFDHSFMVTTSQGISEAFDSAYHVPTVVARALDALRSQLTGASIGIAGPRGSGKSTLIRRFCEESPGSPDLRCLVSAPVEYAPRDFVLHLFSTFCGATVRHITITGGMGFALGFARLVVLYWLLAEAVIMWPWLPLAVGENVLGAVAPDLSPLAQTLEGPVETLFAAISFPNLLAALVIGVGVIHSTVRAVRHRHAWRRSPEGRLIERGRRHLAQIRYLQTYTSGWSGTLKLPAWVEGQGSRSRTRAEQPLSYPEIVAAFRVYAGDVAACLGPRGKIYIGIDELDKIASTDSAERFLNEIKGIFGVPRTYFLISVSDDAMNAFERRGLPFRDAFDSSFDEIIRVGPLAYEESLRLLNRRVVGLTEPYIAFCHCLSGGLSRDLIRAARSVIRAAGALPYGSADVFQEACSAVIREELRGKARAVIELPEARPPHPEALDCLFTLAYRGLNHPVAEVLQAVLEQPLAEPSAEFAAYTYFCLTLEEVFNGTLSATRASNPRLFDDLAAARQALALDTAMAWRVISSVRLTWGLAAWDAPASPVVEA